MDIMEPSSHTGKQEVVKLIQWWEAMSQNSQKESFLEHLAKLLPLPKIKQRSIISYVAVLLKSIIKKFMICLAKIQKQKWIWRKVHKREFLLKTYCSLKLTVLRKWSSTWNLGLKVGQLGQLVWMHSHQDHTVSLQYILTPKKMMKKETKNIKHQNLI